MNYTTTTNSWIMAQFFAIICIIICFVAIYFSWKIYRDTRELRKKTDEDDDEPIPF